MKELIAVGSGVHYFTGGVNIALIEDGRGGVVLIDTGLDSDHAKKFLKVLAAAQLTPTAILNTHSHADHYGGNALIAQKFPNIAIFAPPLEAAIIQNPILEPMYLFGALPPKDLQGKFLMAKPSPAQAIGSGLQRIAGVDMELLDVSGHACQMYAARVGNVLIASDAVFGSEVLHKHPLSFCVDSGQQKQSVKRLQALQGIDVVLMGHGEATRDLETLYQSNLDSFERSTEAVFAACTSTTIDQILKMVCDSLSLTMSNPVSVVLNRSVISAHVAELLASERITQQVQDNLWCFSQK